MRPPRPQQAPHHFIRRWPKSRRAQKGSGEIFRTFSVPLHDCDTRPAMHKLAELALNATPKGWHMERVETGTDQLADEVWVKIRYYR